MDSEGLAGCWKLVWYEFRNSEGRVFKFYGEDPEGVVFFDGKGNFSAQIMKRDRPEINAANPSPEEITSAYAGYMAYFGTYKIDEEKGMITNRVKGALNPAWVGGEQVRYYSFEDDGRIRLRTAPIKAGNTEIVGELVWERVS